MKTATKKKLTSVTAVVCSVALLSAIAPGDILHLGITAEAENNTPPTYYYAPATLYDYKYDTEVEPNYQYKITQSGWEGKTGGNRWQNGSQVPFENINRAISAYYATNSAALTDWPALYFGNFWGSSSACTDSWQKQYTVKPGTYTKVRYYDDADNGGYNNFCVFANNAPKAYNGYTPVQGLVDSTLNGFDGTVGSGTLAQSSVPLPQFDDGFINSTRYAAKYTVSNGFPFNITQSAKGNNVYSYDSLKQAGKPYSGNNRYYDEATGTIQVDENGSSYNYRSDGGISGQETGFYPFNKLHETTADRSNVNYGFGMRVDIPFALNSEGTVGSSDSTKENAVFQFSGDDDIWVFVDGVLVLDLGGDHAKVNGQIDFANQNVQITGKNWQGSVNPTVFDSTYLTNNTARANTTDSSKQTQSLGTLFSNASQPWTRAGKHILTIFYMERGMFESNLSISFNFSETAEEIQDPNHKLIIKEQTVFENVNPGLLSATKAAADKDVFRYLIKTSKTANATSNPYTFPVYENIERVNNEASGSPTTHLAVDTGQAGQTIISYTLYFEAEASMGSTSRAWETGSAKFAIGFYNNTGGYKIDGNQAVSKLPTQRVLFSDSKQDVDYVSGTTTQKYSKQLFVANIPANYIEDYSYFRFFRLSSDKSVVWNYSGQRATTDITDYDKQYYNYNNNGSSTDNWSGRSLDAKSESDLHLTPFKDSTPSGSTEYPTWSTPRTGTENSTSYKNVYNVPFALTDPFANSATPLVGITSYDSNTESSFWNGTSGSTSNSDYTYFDLLYGQSAEFDKQFAKAYEKDAATWSGSGNGNYATSIKVVQSYNTFKHENNINVTNSTTSTYHNGFHDLETTENTTRAVENYYDTTTKAVDTNGANVTLNQAGEKGSAKTSFYFRNNDSSNKATLGEGEKEVKITETFINTVRVKKLQVSKSYTGGGTNDKSFTFKVAFSNIFGNDVDFGSDYSGVQIQINGATQYLTKDGEFTIKQGDVAIIEGVPVGTEYTITEIVKNTGYTTNNFTLEETAKDSNGDTTGTTTLTPDTKDVANQKVEGKITTAAGSKENIIEVKTENKTTNAPKIALSIQKRWVNYKEGTGSEDNLKEETLKLLIQRKTKLDDGWEDVETVQLFHKSDAPYTANVDSVTQTPDAEDYLWTYLKENLLKYKNNITETSSDSDKADNLYTYRILEYSQTGNALLLDTDAIYTEHCYVRYDVNSTDGMTGIDNNNPGELYLSNTYDIPASVPKAGAGGTNYIYVFGITAITLAGAAVMIYKKKLTTQLIDIKGRYMK